MALTVLMNDFYNGLKPVATKWVKATPFKMFRTLKVSNPWLRLHGGDYFPCLKSQIFKLFNTPLPSAKTERLVAFMSG